MLHQFLVLRCESRGEVAVDIQFAHDFPAHEHRDNDLRFGFQRTGQITWVLVDIIDDDRQTAGGSRAANALIERDAGVRRHSPLEGTEHEHGRLSAGFQQIKAHPVVFQHTLVQNLHHGRHEFLRAGDGLCKLSELVTDFFDSASSVHQWNLNSPRRILLRGCGNVRNPSDSFRRRK